MTSFASSQQGPSRFDATQIQLLSGGNATGSVALIGFYPTIQAAINAVPQGTTSTTIRTVHTVLIPPGTYDEDLTVDITNRHIELTALGAVNIGLFNNSFWAASNTRNITIINTAANVDSIRGTFGMGTYIPYGAACTSHAAYSTAFRLSGNIIISTMPVGFTDIDIFLEADIFGNVDSSAFATHNFQLYFTRSKVRGQVKGTRNRIQLADWTVFDDLVTANSYSTMRNSVFSAGMTISTASSGGFKPFGMIACDFSGTFTGPASSLVLDGTSAYFFTANGAALAGGATQLILESASGSGITQLTGDVTAGPGSGSIAATIPNGTITNAKMVSMAANTVKANITGGTAAPTDAALSSTATNNSVAQRTSAADLIATVMRSATHKPIDGAGTAVTFTGGSAASNGAGGNATFSGAAGDSTGTGGAGGAVTITGAAANGDGTVDRAGGAVTINGGASKGSSAGGGLTVNLGTGGAGTGTAGATGGTANINGGTGGIGSATSGSGGNATLKAGTGGAGTAGGNGGTATLNGGTAGVGSASAGNGGPANVSGGSSGSFAGSAGGAVSLAAAGGTGTGSGGAGGATTITGGAAGGDNTVDRAGGSITVTAGTSKGSAAGAAVTMNAGVGGLGTATAGATGGAQSINAGAGGVGSATGGAGGTITISAGAGGASGTPGAGGNIIFRTATTTSLTERFRVGLDGHSTVTGGDLKIATAGNGLDVKGGANCKVGTSVLVAGMVTVSNTSVTASSRIFVTSQTDGGTPGFLRITAKTASTSFVITSSNAADTSTVAWFIVESL